MAQPVKLFYCYAPVDEAALQKLQKHLRLFERSKLIETWYHRKLLAGDTTNQEVETRLDEAQVVILLLSVDFLDSDYCFGTEMARALQLHQEGKVRIVPILLQPCFWDHTPLKDLQPLPRDKKPISERSNHPAAWHDVAMEILAVVKHFQQQEQQGPEPKANGTKSKGKPRPPAQSKRTQVASVATTPNDPKPVRVRRRPAASRPAVPTVASPTLPQHEPTEAEEPDPKSSDAQASTPNFKQRYGGLEEKIKEVSLEILVWEPSQGIDEVVANERQAIHHSLQAEQHQSYLGRELEVPPDFSLQDREVELAFDSDLTIMLAEPLALGELHEFCKYEALLGNTFIMYPKLPQSDPDKPGWEKKIKGGYRLLDYYEEQDIASCKVRTDVLDWVKIRRSIRFSSISRRSGR